MNMLNILDSYLNRITMYKLVLWSLRILMVISLVLALTGTLGFSFKGLLTSVIVLTVVSYPVNWLFSRLLHVPTNTDSYPITLLILYFLLPPATTVHQALLVALAGILAVASKFLIGWNGKHIFNPAAFGAAVVSGLGLLGTAWWIGNSIMWPFVLIAGLLIVRKIRRFTMFLTFVAASFLVALHTAVQLNVSLWQVISLTVTSSPMLFLGTIMLTEPSTMPPRRWYQVIYAALIGFLAFTYVSFGLVRLDPIIALLIGNLFAFAVSPRFRLRLTLKEVQHVSDRVYSYVFIPDRTAAFEPGQYMEWTLPHAQVDSRGNRRTFSFASSPTEADVRLGVKFYEPSSSYKRALRAMQPGDEILGGQVAGDFVLPKNRTEKVVLIAGGIGITPFRSMLQYLVDTKEQRDIVLIYATADPAEVAYKGVLAAAEKQGVRVILLLTHGDAPASWKGSTGQLDEAFVREHVTDYADRAFYVSGPQPMVVGIRKILRTLGVKGIKTDYFSGY